MEINTVDGQSVARASSFVDEEIDDFTTFLKMLTAQIQNQDPLSPMEADAFASQLASFSMVEQQTLTNKNLEAMTAAFVAGGLSGYSSLVGRVAVHESSFEFSGASKEFEFGSGGTVGNSKLVIFDVQNRVVAEQFIEPSQVKADWDGRDSEGRFVEPGTYTAELWRVSDGAKSSVSVSTAATVEEIRFGDGEAHLLLSDGSVISESNVSKLR